jgi:peptidoglycan/xylan/chitin deacetylase (PgdA/CDA1 family)
MSVLYRVAVRCLLVLAVVAFVFTLVLAERPEMLLGDTMLEQSAHGEALNPDLANASSILDLRGEQPESPPVPERTVAITFDDGPDPTWTPAVQAVLDEHGVPGTFFVIGQQVLEHPDIVRDLHAAGHEIGNHTFTHPRVGDLSPWQVRLQYQLTQEAVAGVIGEAPTVFRPPYSGMAPFLPASELAAATTASRDLGMISLLSDRIPRDFDESLSADELVAQAIPPAGAGAVIVFHDGGGNRARTVEALERVIVELEANGYRFATASEFIGLRHTAAGTDHRASLLVTAAHAAPAIVGVLAAISVAFALYGVARLVLLVVLASRQRRSEARSILRVTDTFREPVSVLVPAYNE